MKGLVLGMAAALVLGTSAASWGADKEAAGPKVAPASAETKKDAVTPAPERGQLSGQMAEIAKICELTEKQKKKLAAIDEARIEAMKEVADDFYNKVSDVLTTPQKAKLNEASLMRFVKREFGRAALTDDQLATIKAELATKTKGVLLKMDEKSLELQKSIMTFIREKVLTEEQRETLKAAKKARETRKQTLDEGEAKPEQKADGQ
ncbi:MAG: hypothetical protein WCL44_06605 [bacterium]